MNSKEAKIFLGLVSLTVTGHQRSRCLHVLKGSNLIGWNWRLAGSKDPNSF